uniref:Retroviral polymerase SH3-like domain-containing protein n=1 Tax=Cajanus cajan TaxID=3821 RepID=A0A151TRV8_CAJCA|nr:hypothetical protein KK1_008979 [Cajanus cajan]
MVHDEDNVEFDALLIDNNQQLYEGCSKYSKLSFMLKLYHIKCMCRMSDKAMTMILELLKDAFEHAKFPNSFYEAKKIINKLGLSYIKIPAWPKDCMLYWGEENEGLEECKRCKMSKWKDKKKKSNGPTRTLSLGGKKYVFVIIDDYFRYTWAFFLSHKHESFRVFEIFCYILNKILIIPMLNPTPYELWRGRKSNISYFHPFKCECFILNTKDQLGKFHFKVDKGILFGYSETSKECRMFNSRTSIMEDLIHVKFNDNQKFDKKISDLEDDFTDLQNEDHQTMETNVHLEDQILADKAEGVKTHSTIRDLASYALVFEIKPKYIGEELIDNDWIDPLAKSRSFKLLVTNIIITKYNFSCSALKKVDTTLFKKDSRTNFIVIQIYVDGIIFGTTNEFMCENFSNLMQTGFKMSMMRELKYVKLP